MGYSKLQSVLEEAGLWHQTIGETPAGSANGSNTVFTVSNKPLTDRDYSDTVTKDDVAAYVDGSSVTVASINATTGAVTLSSAPSNGTNVTIDYAFSSCTTTNVTEAIEEADEWLDTELSEVLTSELITASKTVRKLSRLYAAGLLMVRFYGLENNEEQMLAGSGKIKLAKKELADYRARLEANGADNGDTALPISTPKQRLFQRYDDTEGRWDKNTDENFTVNREG